MSDKIRNRKEIGALGEQIAAGFLEQKGFTVIERNYRKPWGEIDLIAEKGDSVRFVEVKTVSRERIEDISREMGKYSPEEQVHQFKLKKVARTAEMYMANKNDNRDFQVDVVAVFLDHSTRKARCRLYEQVL
ncbi:MAG TPA: YraN family protein [Candidatus Paceibacterota bacterium]|nr:YraN family protein [Candidatus Paceibacterota bacterium]